MDDDFDFVYELEKSSKVLMLNHFLSSLNSVDESPEKRMTYTLKKVFKKMIFRKAIVSEKDKKEIEELVGLFILDMNSVHLQLTRLLLSINLINDASRDPEQIVHDISSFSVHMKHAGRLGWIDTREKYVMYTFNTFRNLLTHSSPTSIFIVMPSEDRKATLDMLRESAEYLATFSSYVQQFSRMMKKSMKDRGIEDPSLEKADEIFDKVNKYSFRHEEEK